MGGPLEDEHGMVAGTVEDVAAPAEWAVKAAQRITAVPSSERIESVTLRIARAVEAADRAATERASAVVNCKVSEYFNEAEKARNQGRWRAVDAFMRLSGEYAALAATILKGGA